MFAATAVLLAGCSGRHPAKADGPQPITTDHWKPPVVSGGPSTNNFCTLLVAAYQHVGTADQAASAKVEEEIVGDFVDVIPRMVAVAPPSIASSAAYYFGNEGKFLATFIQAGLNSAHLKPGASRADLSSPQMEAASYAVITFAQKYCNYTIGG